MRPSRKLLAVVLLAALALSACGPEADRQRGGGPGADIGNRTLGAAIDLHGRTDPGYAAPQIVSTGLGAEGK